MKQHFCWLTVPPCYSCSANQCRVFIWLVAILSSPHTHATPHHGGSTALWARLRPGDSWAVLRRFTCHDDPATCSLIDRRRIWQHFIWQAVTLTRHCATSVSIIFQKCVVLLCADRATPQLQVHTGNKCIFMYIFRKYPQSCGEMARQDVCTCKVIKTYVCL